VIKQLSGKEEELDRDVEKRKTVLVIRGDRASEREVPRDYRRGARGSRKRRGTRSRRSPDGTQPLFQKRWG